jgi:3-oxoacyl-[acyl-carrier-protein] synthase-1
MVTGLGFNAPATFAALRAGISAVSELPWSDYDTGKPLRGARVLLPQWWEGVGKLADLLAPAVLECLRAAEPERPESIPLLIGVADPGRPGRTAGLEQRLLDEIEFRLGVSSHPASRVFPGSQVGCAYALLRASELLSAGKAAACVVAGVDSYLQQATLDGYKEQRRLMTGKNSNGFFPGEAGCALLVVPAGRVTRDEVRIVGFGTAQEPATIAGTAPLRATGMTQAVKEALLMSGVAFQDISLRITDLSGEHYKFKEALIVLTRLDRGVRETPLELWHPIEYVGEIGAAIIPCLLGWTLHAQQFGYAKGPLTLCHVGSDAGHRAAMVLKYETARGSPV